MGREMVKVLALLMGVLICGTAAAQLPGVAAAQLEQAPKPNPAAPMYRQTGEQYRIYEFPGTGEPIPYRLFVPESWTPQRKMPVLITLRAGNSINNNHRGGNDLVKMARERGYIVISPSRQVIQGSPAGPHELHAHAHQYEGQQPHHHQRAYLAKLLQQSRGVHENEIEDHGGQCGPRCGH